MYFFYSDEVLGVTERQFDLESDQALDYPFFKKFESLRKYLVEFIYENAKTSEPLDIYIPYLGVSYFDRFISKNRKFPPVEGRDRAYRARAFATCCLALAWKMRIRSFDFENFLRDKSEVLIHQNDILKMELKILNVLDWRLCAVTAMCFVQHFLNLASIPGLNMDKNLTGIIIQSQADIQFTRFKPSVIAASTILAANHFLYPNEHDTVKRKLLAGPHVRLDEEELTSCLNSLVDMCVSRGIIVKKEEAQRIDVEGPSSSGQVEGETEIRDADEETPLQQKSEEDAQRTAVTGPSSSGQVEGETEIRDANEEIPLQQKSGDDAQGMAVTGPGSGPQAKGEAEIGDADEGTPLLQKFEKDAQRMAVTRLNSSRQAEEVIEIGDADEETQLLQKSEEDARRMAVTRSSSSRQAKAETPYRHAPGKDEVGSSEIQEPPVADEEGLKGKINDYVEADCLNALTASDTGPEPEEAGLVDFASELCRSSKVMKRS